MARGPRGRGPRALLLALVAGLLLAGARAPAGAPAAGPSTVGGTIRLAGPPPPPRPPTPVTQDAGVCGAHAADESLVVSAAGGVRDAVVVLRGVERGAPANRPPAVVDNVGCRFVPRVQTIVRGQAVEVRSADPVLHNAHALLPGPPEVTIANLALARAGQRMDLGRRLAAKLPPSGEALVRLRCDVHPWMAGWLVVADHAWTAVTDAEGRFAIRDVPPGRYTLAVWHERLGRAQRQVVVPPGGSVTSVVELTAGQNDSTSIPAETPR